MAILCPHDAGIWEFRDVKPKPSLRILGGFMQKDVFVALAPYERSEFGKKGVSRMEQRIAGFQITMGKVIC